MFIFHYLSPASCKSPQRWNFLLRQLKAECTNLQTKQTSVIILLFTTQACQASFAQVKYSRVCLLWKSKSKYGRWFENFWAAVSATWQSQASAASQPAKVQSNCSLRLKEPIQRDESHAHRTMIAARLLLPYSLWGHNQTVILKVIYV